MNETEIDTREKSADDDEVVSEIEQRPLRLTSDVISELAHEKLLIGKPCDSHDPWTRRNESRS